jgi:hypothetical protein
MATDWVTLRDTAVSTAKSKLGTAWNSASVGATSAIHSLVQTAQFVDEHKDTMTADEYRLLTSQQKQALQNVLTGYEAIGVAAAINTVNAVVAAILAAVPGLVGAL